MDPLAADSYARNFPDVKLWRSDIKKVTALGFARQLKLQVGDLDLLAGCPPCEGFSSVRTLNGSRSTSDPRNDLVLQMQRFVSTLLPKTVLVENVPALAKDDRILSFIEGLKKLRYEMRCEVIDAANYRVPQRRRRMILVASRLGGLPAKAPLEKERCTVRDAIGALPLPGESGDPLHDHGEVRSTTVKALIRSIPRNGGSRLDLPVDRQLPCHQTFDGFKDVYGRMAWDSVAPTITGGCVNPSKGRFLHPDQNRAITLREAALLQTFPKCHFFSMERGKYAAAELIGNALPPRLVTLQARHIRIHLRESQRPTGRMGER